MQLISQAPVRGQRSNSQRVSGDFMLLFSCFLNYSKHDFLLGFFVCFLKNLCLPVSRDEDRAANCCLFTGQKSRAHSIKSETKPQFCFSIYVINKIFALNCDL